MTVLTSTIIQTPPFPSFVFSHKWWFVWLAVNASMVQTKTLCNSVLSNHSGFCNKEAPVCLPLVCSSPVKGNTPGLDIFFYKLYELINFFALNFNIKLWRQLIPVSPFVQWRLSECYTCIHITRSQPQSVHLHALEIIGILPHCDYDGKTVLTPSLHAEEIIRLLAKVCLPPRHWVANFNVKNIMADP